MTLVVGLHGKAGCGKNTAADFFAYQNKAEVIRQLAFGAGVKKATSSFFNIPIHEFYDHKDEVSVRWGMTHRSMLQKVGTEFARNMISKDFWVLYLMPEMEDLLKDGTDVILITDVRFENEAEWVTKMGGYMVQIVRPQPLQLVGEEAEHESEKVLPSRMIDGVLVNDSTPHELGIKLTNLIAPLRK